MSTDGGEMSSLREAMIRADASEEQDERVARTWGPEVVGRALVETPHDDQDDYERARREKEEQDRQAREDEYASWAMEIIVRARQRIGRTKWSGTEGAVKRRIVEALRCLPSDD
jgi:hypothetical protein